MKKVFYLTVVNLLTMNLHAQSSNNSTPSLQKFTDDYLNQFKDSEYISTAALSLQCLDNNGKTYIGSAYSGTLGYKNNFPENQKTNGGSLFQIGSVTKSFISIVLLQLEGRKVELPNGEKHIFSLDDTVEQWFPEYGNWYGKMDDKGIYHPLLIRQLLDMTSGIPTFDDDPAFQKDQQLNPYFDFSLEKILSYETSNILEFSPGTKYEYSNTNFTLAGLLIQKITHTSVEKEVVTRIIDKLKLTHTYFPKNIVTESYSYEKQIKYENLVHGYFFRPNNEYPVKTDITNYGLSWANSAGAIISNPSDIVIYLNELFKPIEKGGKLLTSLQINKLEKNEPGIVMSDDENSTTFYLLGIGKILDKKTNETYYLYQGDTSGFRFNWHYYPERSLYAVFSVNSAISTTDNTFNYISDKILPAVWKIKCF